jgi:hypothetical protein
VLPGLSACSACAAGSYAGQAGLSTCTLCAAGTVAPYNGTSACAACPVGSYQQGNGLTSCSQCPAGTRALGQGSSVCAQCAPGQFSNGTGLQQRRSTRTYTHTYIHTRTPCTSRTPHAASPRCMNRDHAPNHECALAPAHALLVFLFAFVHVLACPILRVCVRTCCPCVACMHARVCVVHACARSVCVHGLPRGHVRRRVGRPPLHCVRGRHLPGRHWQVVVHAVRRRFRAGGQRQHGVRGVRRRHLQRRTGRVGLWQLPHGHGLAQPAAGRVRAVQPRQLR